MDDPGEFRTPGYGGSENLEKSMHDALRDVDELFRAGRRREALEVARALVDRATRAFGEGHPLTNASVNNLATILDTLGQQDEAETLYLRAATSLARAQTAQDLVDLSNVLASLTALKQSRLEFQDAVGLAEQVLELRRSVLGSGDRATGTAVQNLAVAWEVLGETDRANEVLAEYARAAAGEPPVEPPPHVPTGDDLPTVLTVYGRRLQSEGKYPAAEHFLRTAFESAVKRLPAAHFLHAGLLNTLALLAQDQGDHVTALEFFQAAEDILTALHAADAERGVAVSGAFAAFHARLLNNWGWSSATVGHYPAAADLYQEALEERLSLFGPDHPEVAETLNNFGLLRLASGDLNGARELLTEALRIHNACEPASEREAAAANNLGIVHRLAGQYAEGEALYRHAYQIRRNLFGDRHPAVAESLGNLAAVATTRAQYEEAESLHQQAYEIRRDLLGTNHPDVAMSVAAIGSARAGMGRYQAAEDCYRRALETLRQQLGLRHRYLQRVLWGLRDVYAATGRLPEALGAMEEAFAIGEAITAQVFSIGSERQRLAHLDAVRGSLNVLLSLTTTYRASLPDAAIRAFRSVLRRKGLAAEASASDREAVLSGRYPALESELRNLFSLRAELGRLVLQGPGSAPPGDYTRRLEELTAERDELERHLARRVPEIELEQQIAGAEPKAIAGALPEGSVLVEFVEFEQYHFHAVPARGEDRWGERRYVGFVIRHDDPETVHMVDLGEAEAIEQLLVSFREGVEGGGGREPVAAGSGTATWGAAGEGLRRAVFEPLLPALGESRRLFLAPDGALNNLPFEALPDAEGGYIIDAYEISYVATARDVLRFSRISPHDPSPPVVAAYPDFDLAGATRFDNGEAPPGRRSRDLSEAMAQFPPLPGTLEEGEWVASVVGVTPLVGADVLESAIKGVRAPVVMHLATHGFFLPDQSRPVRETLAGGLDVWTDEMLVAARLENPLLRSGLALAGVNTWLAGGTLPAEAEDGLLTAEDVVGMDLVGTQLVVLSACETGRGEIKTGEGVMGLRRAFLLAGAETLVMSLWKVPDRETSELMRLFYEGRLAGLGRPLALRSAQLALRQKYPHPWVWAGFICQGSPHPCRGLTTAM